MFSILSSYIFFFPFFFFIHFFQIIIHWNAIIFRAWKNFISRKCGAWKRFFDPWKRPTELSLAANKQNIGNHSYKNYCLPSFSLIYLVEREKKISGTKRRVNKIYFQKLRDFFSRFFFFLLRIMKNTLYGYYKRLLRRHNTERKRERKVNLLDFNLRNLLRRSFSVKIFQIGSHKKKKKKNEKENSHQISSIRKKREKYQATFSIVSPHPKKKTKL